MFPTWVTSFAYATTLGATFFTRISSLAVFPFVVFLVGLGRWPVAVIVLFAMAGVVRAATALVVPLWDWFDADGEAIGAALEFPARVARSMEGVVLGLVAIGGGAIAVTSFV